MDDVIRATFLLEPAGSAAALAVEESAGVAWGPAAVQGRVVEEGEGRAVVEFPASNWGPNLPLVLSAVVACEAMEDRSFTRCRPVELDLPHGFLPGPAFPAGDGVAVGAIVKPSLGLSPTEVAGTVAALAAGGAVMVKDDELMGDPLWCRLTDRVREVVAAVGSSIVYCANVTGPTASLVDRARQVVDLGATGVMVNAFTQGVDAVLALREADLGVPILAHRVGCGPSARNDNFGATGAVHAQLARMAGADYVLVGAFGMKLFDSDADVRAQLHAARRPMTGVVAATAVISGAIGPANARDQADKAGGEGLLLVVGSAAYEYPGGVESGVRATCEALR